MNGNFIPYDFMLDLNYEAGGHGRRRRGEQVRCCICGASKSTLYKYGKKKICIRCKEGKTDDRNEKKKI